MWSGHVVAAEQAPYRFLTLRPRSLQISTTAMSSSDHSELYSTLAELWTLLDTLAAVPPDMVALPSRDTGMHPPSEFNAGSARAGGFTEEAVTVLASLSYMIYPLEMQPSTSPKCFLNAGLDGRDFEETREMIEDKPIAGSMIVLTESLGGIGCYYVYDTEKSELPDPFCKPWVSTDLFY
jgi:hypothetical protein